MEDLGLDSERLMSEMWERFIVYESQWITEFLARKKPSNQFLNQMLNKIKYNFFLLTL